MPALRNQHVLILRVGLVVALILGAKLVAHFAGWEIISVNPLFSGVVAANVFLMGFLLSGVLADFKESERLPGELAASLENLAQEVRSVKIAKPDASAEVNSCLMLLTQFGRDLLDWFYKKHRTGVLLEHMNDLTSHFAGLEKWTQGTLVARFKQEQGNLRRMLIRIHTIRETSFISSGYLIADATTVSLCIGLILVRIDPFYESLFFVGVISFLMTFLLMLIRDLDNPFGYYERSSGEDVSLKPIEDLIGRLARVSGDETGSPT
jgi:predicted membrane chloride channel (bestrophin family)